MPSAAISKPPNGDSRALILAFGKCSKAAELSYLFSFAFGDLHLCPICLGPFSLAINSLVGIAGSVVMLIVPREPKSTDI